MFLILKYKKYNCDHTSLVRSNSLPMTQSGFTVYRDHNLFVLQTTDLSICTVSLELKFHKTSKLNTFLQLDQNYLTLKTYFVYIEFDNKIFV